MSPINEKSTLWPSTVDGIHEFAWGKSKDADDLFTFSQTSTPTPTEANIYVEYIKKEFSQRMKGKAGLTQPTLDPKPDEIQLVFKKLNTRKPASTQTNEQVMKKDKGVSNQNQHTYDKPQHYIETITKQKKKKEIQPHTIIKKTHITIDEVEQHSGAGNKSDSFEKHIELDESETDIEGQSQYDAATVLNDEGQTKKGSPFKILESQWGASHSQEADPWLPVAVSHAAVNTGKDMDKSFQPHGK